MERTIRVPKVIIDRVNTKLVSVQDIAAYLGLKTFSGYTALIRIFKASGAKLRRGRKRVSPLEGGSQSAYRQHLDEFHGSGFTEAFLQDITRFNLRAIAKKYGHCHQWAHQICNALRNGQGKPRVVRLLTRPDITKQRLSRATSKSKSVTEAARRLKTTTNIVQDRAKRFGVALPNWFDHLKQRTKRRCRRVALLVAKGFSVSQIALKIEVSKATVIRYKQILRRSHRLPQKFQRPAA